MSEPFLAEIRIFAGNFAPRGWAFCEGQLLPIAQHSALFSLIGTTFGGDGRTTTALPDLQGRAPMHPGRGPGLTARRLGQKLGVESVSLAESQIPSHRHEMCGVDDAPSRGSTGMTPAPDTSLSETRGGGAYHDTPDQLVPMSSQALSASGGGQPHENRQPFLCLNYIIALQGIYPPRG